MEEKIKTIPEDSAESFSSIKGGSRVLILQNAADWVFIQYGNNPIEPVQIQIDAERMAETLHVINTECNGVENPEETFSETDIVDSVETNTPFLNH